MTCGVKHRNTHPYRQLCIGSNNQLKNIQLAFHNDEVLLAKDTASVRSEVFRAVVVNSSIFQTTQDISGIYPRRQNFLMLLMFHIYKSHRVFIEWCKILGNVKF